MMLDGCVEHGVSWLHVIDFFYLYLLTGFKKYCSIIVPKVLLWEYILSSLLPLLNECKLYRIRAVLLCTAVSSMPNAGR